MTDTVFILDRNKNVIDYLSNNGVSPDAPFFDDIYIQELSNGVETYEFSTLSNARTSEALELGNYVVFKYDNNYKMFQIMDLEDDHKDGKQIINCYCEMAGLELLTDYCEPFSIEGNVELFFNTVLQDTNWSIGGYSSSLATNIQQVKVDKYTNVYKVIQENISTYGNIEIEYRVEFDGNRLLGYFIDVYENGYRGSKVYKRFEYGENVSGITRKRSLNDFASAMIGQGKDKLTFKDIEWKKSKGNPANKPLGQDFVVDLGANDKFNKHGKYIKGLFDDSDVTNAQDLLLKTWEKLQEVKEPKFDYDVELALTSVEYEDIKIGDTNYVIDNDYNPPIFLEARIGKLEISLTDSNKNKCTLSNYKEVQSKVRQDISEDKINDIVNNYFPIGGDKIEQGAIGNGHIDTTYYESIKTDIVQASVADVQRLIVKKADIEDLNATNASIENIKVNKANVEDLTAINATVNNLKSDKVSVSELSAVKAQIGTLEAGEIVADKLHAQDANIKNLTSNKANISDLNATNATVGSLNADVGKINTLLAKKATIEELNVVKAQIGTLNVGEVIADIIHGNTADIGDLTADIGEIQTLVGENLTMKNIASLILTSKKVTVEDAFIKNAMIDNVSAAKINTGILNTNLVNIQSEDGSLVLNGTLQQFKDENGKVRIQMGKDAQGNFTFGLFDSTGIGTLIDSTGIKEKAIGDGLIVDKMIGNNANISGSKLDIDSVVTSINGSATSIKGSKIKLDTQNQTLDLAFNTLNTTVTNTGKTVESQGTSIETMQGKIQTLITNTTITEGDTTTTIKDAYSSLKQNVGEFGVALKSVESEFDNMAIGGRNLLANSAPTALTGYSLNTSANWKYELMDCATASKGKSIKCTNLVKAGGGVYTFPIKKDALINGEYYTASVMIRSSSGTLKLSIKQEQMVDIKFQSLGTEWMLVSFTSKIDTSKTSKGVVLYVDMNSVNVGDWFEFHSLMLEKSTKPSNFTEAPEDIAGEINSLGTRVKTAETALTLDGLTTTIGDTYITPTQLNNKGYATTSDVTQSVNSWSAKFTESGGYNKLYNGDFRRGLELWDKSGNIDSVLCTTLGCPDNMYGIDMLGQIGKVATYSQEFTYDRIGKLTLSYWTYITTSGVNGTTNPYSNIQIVVNYTDGTIGYLTSKAPSATNTWEKITFTVNLTKRPNKIKVELINRDTTKHLYFTNIMLEDGEIANAFTPNPNEVFDGETNISKHGVKVIQSNYNGYTNMKADGFYLNNGKEDVIKCTSTGLVVKGQIHVTSGSISEGALAGTLIDGQYIKTGTIQADSMLIGDFNNYCTQPTNFTITAGSDTGSPGYKVSGTQHMFITSKLTQLRGGEQFSITGKAYGSSTNTTQTKLNFQFIWRDASGNAVLTGGLGAVAVNINTTIDVNLVLTVPPRPQNAIYGNIKIFVGNNIETLIYFQPNIRLMMTGNLIVDGAIDGKTITGTDIIGSTFSSKDGLFTVKEDGEVSAWALSAGIISTELLSVNEISNPQYPKSMEGSMQVYIDPNTQTPSESFENGGIYKSFADLEELAPRNLNGYWLQVRLMSDITENVVYDTFFNGTLAVELNGKTLRGYIRLVGRTLSARLYGNIVGNTKGIMGSIMPNAGCNRLGYRYCVVAEMCDLVVYDIKAYKSVVTDINSGCFLYTDRASGYVSNVVPINEPYLMLRAHSMSNVYLESSNGMTSDFPIHSVSGAIITVNATKQAGRKGSTNHIWRANNGQVFADGVTWDTTVSSGNNDSTSNDKVTKTVTVKSTFGDTYRSTYTSWKKDGTVRQGNAYGSGNCDGFWFFGSSLSTYLAKNPTAITITVTRQTGGSGSDVNLTMITHNHTSRPSGAGTVKETLRTFKAGANKSTTITLSSAEIAKLKNYKGVGLKTSYSATNYAVCSGTCTIKVTYEE